MRRLASRPRLLAALTITTLLASVVGAPSAGAAARERSVRATPASVPDDHPRAAAGTARIVDMATLPKASRVGTSSPVAMTPAGDAPRTDRSLTAAAAPAQATANGADPATQVVTFAGLAGGIALEPPDPSIGVGPDHLVTATDSRVRISDRAGATEATLDLLDFLGLGDLEGYEASFFSSRVAYDAVQRRWIVADASFDCYPTDSANVGTGFLDISVSHTADPSGVWTSRSIAFDDAVPIDPSLGTSTDKVVVGMDVHPLVAGGTLGCEPGVSPIGSEIDVMPWSQLATVGGGVSVAHLVSGDAFPDDYTAWRPALQTPAASSTAVVIGRAKADGAVVYSRITGLPPGLTTLAAIQDLSAADVVAPFATPPDPAQPGSPSTITDADDGRPGHAVWQNGTLAFTSTYPCDPAGGATETRACIRLTELATGTTTPTRVQDMLIAQGGADLYGGGVAYARNGDLHLAWTRSSASAGDEPSVFTAHQAADAAAGSISDIAAIPAGNGTGTYPGSRWGPTAGVAQDPQASGAAWAFGAYSAGASGWATVGVQLRTSGATFVPIEPLRILDTRFGVGLTGAFSANTAREFTVAGFASGAGSIPAEAVAVTGNVTVTGQTKPGYVSVTTTKTATPTTSTINFPTGDNRANNITIPVSAAGTLSAVYKAPAGSTANVVFDVSGYFLAGDAEAGYTPMTPVRVLDSRPGIGIGLTGPFTTGVPRELAIAGGNGIPANAVAVTANLTVVGQTRPGYVSVTPTSDAAPDTSTINFPTGDTRANGLTATLDGGSLWLVYVAGAAASTNLILDVTGFYLPAGDGLAFYPLDPGRLMDTRSTVLTGLTGRFTSGTPRTLATAGHWGVPADAAAITGNLTVVSQTAGGYVSATPIATGTPSTSTLNFPVGDTRANGITVPLAGDGSQAFVYKASGGATTHLILDVSGYFE